MFPILFRIPFLNIPIYTYGFMITLGVISAVILGIKRAKTINLPDYFIIDLAAFAVVGGIIGARILYIIYYFEDFKDDPIEMFKIWKGGVIFYGGLVSGIISCIVYIKSRKQSILKIADLVIPLVFLGLAFGRLGCFSRSCCFGKETKDSPFAVRFPKVTEYPWGEKIYSFPYLKHLESGKISSDSNYSLPVHPVQLYESVASLMIFIFLWLYWKRRRFEGQIFTLGLLAYSIARFSLEFYRADMGRLYGLSFGQYCSILVFFTALFLYFKLSKKARTGF